MWQHRDSGLLRLCVWCSLNPDFRSVELNPSPERTKRYREAQTQGYWRRVIYTNPLLGGREKKRGRERDTGEREVSRLERKQQHQRVSKY